MVDGLWRYRRSKLGNILFTRELAHRLEQGRDPADRHIYANVFFPGNIVTEQWYSWDDYFGKIGGSLMRRLFSQIGQDTQDGAATAIYLAASQAIQQTRTRGQYFIPIATPCKTTPIAADMKLAQELWVSPPCRGTSRYCQSDNLLTFLDLCLGLDKCPSHRDSWFRLADGGSRGSVQRHLESQWHPMLLREGLL
jgi:hypothetical protein